MGDENQNIMEAFWAPDLRYFEEMRPWDYFASSSYITIGTLGILLNLWAVVVVVRNKKLSAIIKFYLISDHIFRLISDITLFYPAACPLIRAVHSTSSFDEFDWEDTPEFRSAHRTMRPICALIPWATRWGSEANRVFATIFNTIVHLLELFQLAISLNRWLAVSFGGRYHHVLARTKHLQVDLMVTVVWLAFYKYSFSNNMYFDDFSYALTSSEIEGYTALNSQVLEAVRILSVVVTVISILLDWSTFVLLKRHLEHSRKLTQSDAKTGAEIRLAKQLLFNHGYSIFVAACSCYILIVFTPIESIQRSSSEAYDEMSRNMVLSKTSWFLFLATTFFPAFGTVVNGTMTIIFLSPEKEKTSSKVTLVASKT